MNIFKRVFSGPPPLPVKPCRVLMAEIVDDYTPLSLQQKRYEVDFDPGRVSRDGLNYNFGDGPGRATGWQPLSTAFGEPGFYVVSEL